MSFAEGDGRAMERIGDDSGGAALGVLVRETHEAASKAEMLGYSRMARLLDECGFALAANAPTRRRAIEERARKALAVWAAIQSF
jgi:hypothetical protein